MLFSALLWNFAEILRVFVQFPVIKANPWTKVFNAFTPDDAIDLIGKLLVYTPTARFDSFDAMTHPYFDDLRVPNCVLPGCGFRLVLR